MRYGMEWRLRKRWWMKRTRKILIVDDDPNFPRVVKHYLERLHFPAEIVKTAPAALERCREEEFSLLVVDINLPVMRGLGFLQLFKIRHRDVPVLVLSAFSSMDNMAAAFRYGADEFLEKPCDTLRLLNTIQRLAGCSPAEITRHEQLIESILNQ